MTAGAELRGLAAGLAVTVEAELRDPFVAPADTGLVASSVAVRCRDNAVPSVLGHVGPRLINRISRCRPTMPEREFTCPQLRQERS